MCLVASSFLSTLLPYEPTVPKSFLIVAVGAVVFVLAAAFLDEYSALYPARALQRSEGSSYVSALLGPWSRPYS